MAKHKTVRIYTVNDSYPTCHFNIFMLQLSNIFTGLRCPPPSKFLRPATTGSPFVIFCIFVFVILKKPQGYSLTLTSNAYNKTPRRMSDLRWQVKMQDKAKNNPGLLLPNYVVDHALYYYGNLLFQGMNHRFFLYSHSCFSTIIISLLCKTMHLFLILISVTGNQKYFLNHCQFRLNPWNGLLLEREDIFQIYAQQIRDTSHISQYSKIVIYPMFSFVVWKRERFNFFLHEFRIKKCLV